MNKANASDFLKALFPEYPFGVPITEWDRETLEKNYMAQACQVRSCQASMVRMEQMMEEALENLTLHQQGHGKNDSEACSPEHCGADHLQMAMDLLENDK